MIVFSIQSVVWKLLEMVTTAKSGTWILCVWVGVYVWLLLGFRGARVAGNW
jgi:hypothetical protein